MIDRAVGRTHAASDRRDRRGRGTAFGDKPDGGVDESLILETMNTNHRSRMTILERTVKKPACQPPISIRVLEGCHRHKPLSRRGGTDILTA